ncbi:hypothetical protein ACWDTQ_31060 [Streptomyces cellulosae]
MATVPDDLQELVDFLDMRLMELAGERGLLQYYEDHGLRFRAEMRPEATVVGETVRVDGREAGRAWLERHDPARTLEVTSTLVTLARELVRLARLGRVPDFRRDSVREELLRAVRLWEDAEGFRPEWKKAAPHNE